MLAATLLVIGTARAGGVSFGASTLAGTGVIENPTTLAFGPDGRLYVGQQSGFIRAYTIERVGEDDYVVVDTEIIDHVRLLPNHDDDGTPNPFKERLVTGLMTAGTAASPVLYVTSSDWRISVGNDSGLDTNSGIVSRLTWNGSDWDHVQLVRGLPRSEENHGPNGMALDTSTNTLYIAQGGNTNQGAPSHLFSDLPEYALSAAILSVDLNAIGNQTYDIPTLDDPTRPNTGPDGSDEGDPFGGNDGLNQARIVLGGPVQVYAPGFRNPYDVVLTEDGQLYTVDNGANAVWGGPPVGEGPRGTCTNELNEGGESIEDGLHHITGPGYYGGHPNPTRASTSNTFGGQSPVPFDNPIECDDFVPFGSLMTWPTSVNGITEYTASNFDEQMRGDLLAAMWSFGKIYRIQRDGDGNVTFAGPLLNTGDLPIDVTVANTASGFSGSIWVATYGDDNVRIFEPADGIICTGEDSPRLDEDGDGFSNSQEIALGTDPCSAASAPDDLDNDGLADVLDPDDDNDGLADWLDPFAIDAANGAATSLPAYYQWALGDPGFGLLGLGFTGLMSNGIDEYNDLFDPLDVIAGGAAGKLTIGSIPAGTAVGTRNDQQYGLQFGAPVSIANGPFTIDTTIEAPFFNDAPPVGNQAIGLFFGTGTQDDFVRWTYGAGGLMLLSEVANVPSSSTFDVPLAGAQRITLSLTIDPVAASVVASYAVDGGRPMVAGSPLPLEGAVRDAVTGPDAIAIGIIATSDGGPPFAATWDDIGVAFAGATAAARLTVTHGAAGIEASTYNPESFRLWNESTGGQQIVRITIDLSTAILPDVVFDPFGLAGDTLGKDVTADDGASVTGFMGHTLMTPHDDGFDAVILDFDDFQPDEMFAFSGDIDPTTIRGADPPGPEDSGSISGLELSGAIVTVVFDDGATLAATLAPEPGSVSNSEVDIRAAMTTAPSITASGSTDALIVTGTTNQVIRVNGEPNTTIRVVHLESGLYVEGLEGGGFDVDPFETNRIISVENIDATIGADGHVDIPVALTMTGPQDGTNQFLAFEMSGDDIVGPMSAPLTFILDTTAEITLNPADVEFGPVPVGSSVDQPIVISAIEGTVNLVAIELIGDVEFSLLDAPATPLSIEPGAPLVMTVRFTAADYGPRSATLRITDGDSTTVDAALSGSGASLGPVAIQYRVNAGGTVTAAPDGDIEWSTDTFSNPSPYLVGVSSTSTASEPVMPGPDLPTYVPIALFSTERWDAAPLPEMQWSFPVEDGLFEVRLFFAETYGPIDQPGERVFDVYIEDQLAFDNVDPVAIAGHSTGFMLMEATEVTDGSVDIEFIHVVQNPTIAAIEIRAVVEGCPTDLDGDGVTSFEDLLLVLSAWGSNDPARDPDGDGETAFGDVLMILTAWGDC